MMKTIWTVIMKYNVSLKTGCKDWICGKGEWQIHDIINHFEQRAHMTAHAQLLRKSHGIAIKRIRAFIYISVIKINLLPQEEFPLSTLQSTPLSPCPLCFITEFAFWEILSDSVSTWKAYSLCLIYSQLFTPFSTPATPLLPIMLNIAVFGQPDRKKQLSLVCRWLNY